MRSHNVCPRLVAQVARRRKIPTRSRLSSTQTAVVPKESESPIQNTAPGKDEPSRVVSDPPLSSDGSDSSSSSGGASSFLTNLVDIALKGEPQPEFHTEDVEYDAPLSDRLLERREYKEDHRRFLREAATRRPEEHLSRSLKFLKQIRETDEPGEANIPRVSTGFKQHRLPWYKRRTEGYIGATDNAVLKDVKPLTVKRPLPTLQHGLKRTLFNPGVVWARCPRTNVFNFDPQLHTIPKIDDFDFDRVNGFVPSSQDTELWELAKGEGCLFTGSTSSLTGVLSQIYFLLSNEKSVDTSVLSSAFRKEPKTFTPGQRMPVSIALRYKDGVYQTDADASHLDGGSSETILSKLGTVLEKRLTLRLDEFDKYMKSSEERPFSTDEGPLKEAYRYAKVGNFLMRSQLDCHHPSLPGSGVFDIKTRAAMPIRLDVWNYEDHIDYKINKLHGTWESFEKEYYDLIRSAFLKYSFQARIGNMDGVFVAYHNTAQMFGFQYIPLSEMDARLFGHERAGKRVFEKCIGLMNEIYNEIITYFPEQTVHCTFETKEFGQIMHIWLEPAEWFKDQPKHVVQLDVKFANFSGYTPVTGHKAVEGVDNPWNVSYSIAKSSLPQEKVLANRQAAYDRQLHMYRFGLNVNDVMEHGDTVSVETRAKARDVRSNIVKRLRSKNAMNTEHSVSEAHPNDGDLEARTPEAGSETLPHNENSEGVKLEDPPTSS